MAAIVTFVVLLSAASVSAAERRDIGLSQSGAVIEASVVAAGSASAPTVLLVGGLAGRDDSSRAVEREVASYEGQPQRQRPFRLLAVAVANPDGRGLQFPPAGAAYRENAESHALWRWIGIQAPDLVLVAGADGAGLAQAVSSQAPAGTGRIPARRVNAADGMLKGLGSIAPSEARLEIERRRARQPRQFAEELSATFGREFDQLTYIPGMALIARLRLGHLDDVRRLAEPYASGARENLGRPNSLALAGHLVFGELAERTGDRRYVDLVREAAAFGFTADGGMQAAMPFHGEMSDSVFMDVSILARAGKVTGERRYFDMAARHLSFMQKLVLRPDGLYRHSPLTDAAWGRGNGFPALGLALTLSDFPADHPDFARIRDSFRAHMAVLARLQNEDGLWRQVVDHRGAYPEYSATAMIGTAMLRGVRRGWLDRAEYMPRVERAWQAVLTRSGAGGVLLDVGESTNKQPSLADYLRRAAIHGPDPRGGAMAMLFATELAGLDP